MSNEVESRPPTRAAKSRARKQAGPVDDAANQSPPEPTPSAATAVEPTITIGAESDDQLSGAIEAVLLSVDRPVSAIRLAEALGLLDEQAADAAAAREEAGDGGRAAKAGSPLAKVRAAVELLNQQYEQTGRSFRIEAVAGGFRVMTLPRFAPVIENFLGKRERTSLSRPAVETLAIIAYKQPITRAQLEAIRGVACGEVLKTLMERRLVTMTGRAEELGRPMLYGTTRQFLEAFGLSGLKDLPSPAEFKAKHAGGETE